MALLDTTFLVDLLRHDPVAGDFLASIRASGERVCTSPVCACELFAGAFGSDRPDRLEIVRGALERIEVLPLTLDACEAYGRLAERARASGRGPGPLDLMVAASALAAREALVTRNARHFEGIPGLVVRSY